jgi:preprotein translocase subunit SecE
MRLLDYIRETKGEMKHVSWPTKKQAIAFTVIVVAISIIVAFYLGLFDFIFSFLLEQVVV